MENGTVMSPDFCAHFLFYPGKSGPFDYPEETELKCCIKIWKQIFFSNFRERMMFTSQNNPRPKRILLDGGEMRGPSGEGLKHSSLGDR